VALKHLLSRVWHGKSVGGDNPYSGVSGPGPSPTVDIFRRQRPPTPYELVLENVNTAFSCASLNSDTFAKVPLRLYVQNRRGESRSKMSRRGDCQAVDRKRFEWLKKSRGPALAKATEIEEVFDHPLLDLLNNPNPDSEDGVGMSLHQLLKYTQLYQEVIGRCYWWTPLDGFGGRPSAIWVLAAQHVREIVDGTTGCSIDRYSFGAGTRARDYEPSEIVPFRFADLTNPYIGGVSPMRAAFEKHKLSRKIDARTNAILSNGGMPAGLFVPAASEATGGTIDKQAAKRLQSKLQAKMAMNVGGVIVAEHAGQFVPLEWPTRDIADVEQLSMNKHDMCNCYGVPIGLLEPQEQNLTAIQSARLMHAEQAIEPRCKSGEATLNRMLVSKYDDTGRLFLAFDSPLPDDNQNTREESKVLMQGNSITRNELRQRHGMSPIDGPEGDELVKISQARNDTGPTDDQQSDAKQKKLRRELLHAGYTPAEID
jgi:HK97 family phage portal protein